MIWHYSNSMNDMILFQLDEWNDTIRLKINKFHCSTEINAKTMDDDFSEINVWWMKWHYSNDEWNDTISMMNDMTLFQRMKWHYSKEWNDNIPMKWH